MEFFNKVEDVIDIQLTSYGKEMFSQGKFMPEFYMFYDNNIIYDSEYAGISLEKQNDIVPRIQSTQYLKAQTYFSSSKLENFVAKEISYAQFNNVVESNSKFFRALGRNSVWSDKFPSWRVDSVTGSVGFNGDLNYAGKLSIPTLSASLTSSYSKFSPGGRDEQVFILDDKDRLILDIQELNAVFDGEGNFDIEVFMETEDAQAKLVPLSFINKGENSDSLEIQTLPYKLVGRIEGTSEEIRDEFPTLDQTYVEYFLTVNFDDDITDLPISTTAGSPTLYKTGYQQGQPSEVCDPDVDGGRLGVD